LSGHAEDGETGGSLLGAKELSKSRRRLHSNSHLPQEHDYLEMNEEDENERLNLQVYDIKELTIKQNDLTSRFSSKPSIIIDDLGIPVPK